MAVVEAGLGGEIFGVGSEVAEEALAREEPQPESPFAWLDDPSNPQPAAEVLRAYGEQIEALTGRSDWGYKETIHHVAYRGAERWLAEQHKQKGVSKKERIAHYETLVAAFASLLAKSTEVQTLPE